MSAEASPLTSNGQKIQRWARTPDNPIIVYYLDPDLTTEQQDGARLALAKWTEVPTSFLTFEETTVEADAQYVITFSTFRDTAEFIRTVDDGGEQISAALKIGLDERSITGDFWVNFIMHETGHIIGLRHTTTDGAIMSYRRGSRTVLNLDDEFAITRIYPTDGNLEYNVGCASLKDVSNGSKGPPGAAILWFLLFALIYGSFRLGHAIRFHTGAPS